MLRRNTRAFLLILLTAVLVSCPGPGSDSPGHKSSAWQDLEPRLQHLAFDDFVDASYREILRRTPELVTEMGLDDAFDMPGDRLNDFSDSYLKETEQIQQGIFDLLQDYSPQDLSTEQRITLEAYRWYLDDCIRGREFRYHSFPVSHFITAEPSNTELFFSDIQPLSDREDAERYLRRLEQVGRKMEQLADALVLRQEMGISLPLSSLRLTLNLVRTVSRAEAKQTVYYRTFQEKTADMDLSETEHRELLSRAESLCSTSVLSGYRTLEEKVLAQMKQSPPDDGVWRLPGGKDYYRYALRHHTTTGYTPEEIHQAGLRELERIHRDMRDRFSRLGMDTALPVAELYKQLDREGVKIPASEIVDRYTQLILAAEKTAGRGFDHFPRSNVVVKGVPSGGYYVTGTPDGSRPGIFFAGDSQGEPYYKMPTLTFHETVPGHHYQLSLAMESPLPLFRQSNLFLGYTEGWALYAERLMAEWGFYDGDPEGDLGRLQAAAFRAARQVVDTGIHYFEWDFDRAVAFFMENTGFPAGYALWEIRRYLVWPGQSAAYMTGMQSILSMREEVRRRMDKDFDLKRFHAFLLDQGAVPLEVLERRLEESLF